MPGTKTVESEIMNKLCLSVSLLALCGQVQDEAMVLGTAKMDAN